MANRTDVRVGQRWSRKGDALSYRVVSVPGEEGAPAQLSGPGPLRGVIEVDVADLANEWAVLEPTAEETSKLLDRCARTAMQEFDWLNRPASEATAYLRGVLERVQGSLPSWMSPEFWTVEYQVVAQPSSESVRVTTRGFALVPTSLSGRRIAFYPQPPSIKAVLPDDNLFVVGDNHLDALIGLARLLSAKLESTRGTTP